jgi:hypothetical protein
VYSVCVRARACVCVIFYITVCYCITDTGTYNVCWLKARRLSSHSHQNITVTRSVITSLHLQETRSNFRLHTEIKKNCVNLSSYSPDYIHEEVKDNLKSRSVSYHSLSNILSFRFLSKIVNQNFVILSVLCECGRWSVTPGEEHTSLSKVWCLKAGC